MSDELERRLAATLERSLAQIDGDVAAALQAARRRALRRRWGGAGLAVAAGIAALLLVPRLLPPASETPVLAQQPLSTDSARWSLPDEYAHLEVDPELLADWELLEAIGERPDAT
jgi:ferric-dicitrate binding protein FerR (iron transport regulator)